MQQFCYVIVAIIFLVTQLLIIERVEKDVEDYYNFNVSSRCLSKFYDIINLSKLISQSARVMVEELIFFSSKSNCSMLTASIFRKLLAVLVEHPGRGF